MIEGVSEWARTIPLRCAAQPAQRWSEAAQPVSGIDPAKVTASEAADATTIGMLGEADRLAPWIVRRYLACGAVLAFAGVAVRQG